MTILSEKVYFIHLCNKAQNGNKSKLISMIIVQTMIQSFKLSNTVNNILQPGIQVFSKVLANEVNVNIHFPYKSLDVADLFPQEIYVVFVHCEALALGGRKLI